MKATLYFCLICLFHSALHAQNQQEAGCANCPDYDAFMKNGKTYLEKENFSAALKEFQAAQIAAGICNCNNTAPSDSIKSLFKGIQLQKDAAIAAQNRAIKAEKNARIALAETEKAKNEEQVALDNDNKLVNAFYFYAGRFALAYGEKNGQNIFYFIDENGDEVSKLGQWEKAEQFGDRGFAKEPVAGFP